MKIKLKGAARIGEAAKGNVRVVPADEVADVPKGVADELLAAGRAEKVGPGSRGDKPADDAGQDPAAGDDGEA